MEIVNFAKLAFVLVFIVLISCSEQDKQTDKFIVLETDTSWKSLSLREKIGQLVCVRYDFRLDSYIGDDSIQTFMDKYPVGSLFLSN